MKTKPGYRWDATTAPKPFDTRMFPRKGVIGEIKPHNPAGIAAGIVQLRGRSGITRGTPQLITYRQVPGQPARYEILGADSAQLRSVIQGRAAKITTWYTFGIVESAQAARMIPLWECPTKLGNVLEGPIRVRYAKRVGATLDRKDDAALRGPDLKHELREMAEFLRELAVELEAEAGYPRY